MKLAHNRVAQLAAVAVSTLSLGAIVASATPAMAQPPVCGDHDCRSLAPATLSATQGTLNLTSLQLENISASATDVETGRPLVGALVRFYTSGGRLLGQTYTNYKGTAAITSSENFGPGTIQELLNGYDAVLVGDGVHTTATAQALQQAHTDGLETLLVLEDDVLILPGATRVLRHAMTELARRTWTLLHLGGADGGQPLLPSEGCRHLGNVTGITTTHAIAYHHSAFAPLLDELPDTIEGMTAWTQRHTAIDQYLARWDQPDVYRTVPVIVTRTDQTDLLPAQLASRTATETDGPAIEGASR